MNVSTERFLRDHRRYFSDSYEQFCAFGGPCVYFHQECLRACEAAFLSDRHIEMLYATLTAWGMHRMGDADTTKTKLTEWKCFRGSITNQRGQLQRFRDHSLLRMSESEYSDAIWELQACYKKLDLSVSDATIVANSKALFHLFPRFVPPIDRQYTVRFFRQPQEKWRDKKGKFRPIQLPPEIDAQFQLFQEICTEIKRLAARVDTDVFEEQEVRFGVTGHRQCHR